MDVTGKMVHGEPLDREDLLARQALEARLERRAPWAHLDQLDLLGRPVHPDPLDLAVLKARLGSPSA